MFFSYKVIDKQGKEIEGRIEARDEQAAVDNLLNRGYSVLSLQAEKESTDIKNILPAAGENERHGHFFPSNRDTF